MWRTEQRDLRLIKFIVLGHLGFNIRVQSSVLRFARLLGFVGFNRRFVSIKMLLLNNLAERQHAYRDHKTPKNRRLRHTTTKLSHRGCRDTQSNRKSSAGEV